MKKLILTTAVALGAMMMAASGAQAKFVFALVPKNMNNPFFDQARDGCKKAEAESNGAFDGATAMPSTRRVTRSSTIWTCSSSECSPGPV